MDIKTRFHLICCWFSNWSRRYLEVSVYDRYVWWRSFLSNLLFFTIFIGFPILLAEFIIGRGSQKDAISAYSFFAPGTQWHIIGIIGMITSFILLSFYSAIGGWILFYMVKTMSGALSGLSDSEYGAVFDLYIADPKIAVISQLIFMLITIVIVSKVIQKGIEKASKVMMPSLFIGFIIIIIRFLTLDHAIEGVAFFLYPDFSNLTSRTVLFALGQSFFSISVGVSVMVTYSSYLSKKEDITKSAFTIVTMNIIISLLAGLAIFPAVFSFGFDPTDGPGLLFVVLPAVFNKMPFGAFFLLIFFLLFLFATLTSAFSMLEIIVASMTKKDQSKRKKVTWITGVLIFLVGVPSALSFGVLSEFTIFGQTIFDFFDYIVSNILMPLGALAIAIFTFTRIPKETLFREISMGSTKRHQLFALWFLVIK